MALVTRSITSKVGITYRNEFFGVLQVVLLNQYQCQFVRDEESPREIYVETAWRDRQVFEDEVATGITAAQTRFIIKARLRHQGRYKVSLEAKNQFQYAGKYQWTTGPLSKMARKYLNTIAKELKR